MGKKFGLGKGLSALIPEEISDNSNETNQLLVDINKIKCDSNQPRKSFDTDKNVFLVRLCAEVLHKTDFFT